MGVQCNGEVSRGDVRSRSIRGKDNESKGRSIWRERDSFADDRYPRKMDGRMQGSAPRSGKERNGQLVGGAGHGMEEGGQTLGCWACIQILYIQCSRRRAGLFDGLNAAHPCYHGIRPGRVGAFFFLRSRSSSGLDGMYVCVASRTVVVTLSLRIETRTFGGCTCFQTLQPRNANKR